MGCSFLLQLPLLYSNLEVASAPLSFARQRVRECFSPLKYELGFAVIFMIQLAKPSWPQIARAGQL